MPGADDRADAEESQVEGGQASFQPGIAEVIRRRGFGAKYLHVGLPLV